MPSKNPQHPRKIYIVTIGLPLPRGGCHIVGVATSHSKAEEFVHDIEDETGCIVSSDDIDIETWEVNTVDMGEGEGNGDEEHDY